MLVPSQVHVTVEMCISSSWVSSCFRSRP